MTAQIQIQVNQMKEKLDYVEDVLEKSEVIQE